VAAAADTLRQEVAAVNPREDTDHTQILICYDGSKDAERAIDTAAALFAPRHAVVLDVAPTLTFAESMALTSSVVVGSAFEDLNTADALQRAEAGAAHARGAGLQAAARATIATTTWEGIVEVADEIDAQVIVIGSRGLSGLREFTSGSVSHDVATHARRPVLIVPPAA
jgi:nucleotide-binding universal stress UspA family protein